MRTVQRSFIFATIALAVFLAGAHPARAQTSAIDTYAITNARIVPVSGPVIERGTLLIRNGLIAGVGAQVGVPADARVIDGTGLTVYPGLIDSNTTLGLPQAAPVTGAGRGSPVTVPTPAAATAAATPAPIAPLVAATSNPVHPPGMQPDVLVVDLLQPGGAQLEAARNAGITAALTAPRDGILVGQSAFINLAGETAQQMIVRAPVALHVSFTPLRSNVYPGSLMGVFSSLRQMLLDAGRQREATQIYERSPRGLRRPAQDKALSALYPVLAREMPVVMYANTEREIRRALELAAEFNLRLILAGGAESWKVADRLRDVPVLLSLNFPRRTATQLPEADPDPLRVLRERVNAPKTAGRLAAARVRFAFQSGAMTNMTDFLANVTKAIENGLSRDEALRALTIHPAEILGVADRLGSLEVGKIANLTVTRGDIFDRNMRLAQVFIDGRPFELKQVTPGAVGQASGTWTLGVNLGEGDQAMTLVLQQEGENLRGSIQGSLGSAQIANASIGTGGDLRFTAPLTIGGVTTEATFTGTINGNEMRGTVQVVGRSPGSFTGTRAGGPPAMTTPAPPSSAPPRTPATQPPAQPPAQPGPTAAADLSGDWTLALSVGPRTVPGTLSLRQEGTKLSGTLHSPFGTTELADGSIGVGTFRFVSTASVEGRTVEMSITGVVGDNKISGSIISEIGSTTFTGTKP
ncbi:MAG TPA: amidohydrolase family protein [Pyrinomonadaceae bacterium]|jgi:imidazolonepropionase-like amidohydrolase